METKRWTTAGCLLTAVIAASGCAPRDVSLADFSQPQRAAALDAYDTFVGKWTWEAELVNAADDADRNWTGTAEWKWTLDNRALRGTMSAACGDTKFEGEGLWSWHPKKKQYIWSMLNNWGYPQTGTAKYNADCQCWCMDYKSVGLDGTASKGRYCMKVIDENTLDWKMVEKDATGMVTKMEMKGTYRRVK